MVEAKSTQSKPHIRYEDFNRHLEWYCEHIGIPKTFSASIDSVPGISDNCNNNIKEISTMSGLVLLLQYPWLNEKAHIDSFEKAVWLDLNSSSNKEARFLQNCERELPKNWNIAPLHIKSNDLSIKLVRAIGLQEKEIGTLKIKHASKTMILKKHQSCGQKYTQHMKNLVASVLNTSRTVQQLRIYGFIV